MRCTRCNGSLVRGWDGMECLMCGHSSAPPAGHLAALMAEHEADKGRRPQATHPRPRDMECPSCGGMFSRLGMGGHRVACATSAENSLRSPLTLQSQHRARTQCPAGHPYEGENLYIYPNGNRECRECHRVRERSRYWARKAAG